MIEQLPQIVEESVKLELNLVTLYKLFSSLFSEDADFWDQLAQEEKQHASLIKAAFEVASSRNVLNTYDEFPAEILSPSLKELVKMNNRILSLKRSFIEKPPSRNSTFGIASSLEQSAGEMHYNEAMDKPSDNEYIKILQRLNKDDKDHCQRILAYMSSQGF